MNCKAHESALVLQKALTKQPKVAMSGLYVVPTAQDGIEMVFALTNFSCLVGLCRIGQEPQGRIYFRKDGTEFIFHIVFGETEEEMREFDEFIAS